jgi:hypothetical protein
LVEAGEKSPGPVRHQQGVEEIVTPVERLVVGRETYVEGVLSLAEGRPGDDDVFVG